MTLIRGDIKLSKPKLKILRHQHTNYLSNVLSSTQSDNSINFSGDILSPEEKIM